MVVNVLKDGTIIKDMSNIVVPINESTKRAYDLIIKKTGGNNGTVKK